MSEIPSGKKAKGAMMVALAMIVNNTKQLDWAGLGGLTEADLKMVHQGIISSQWYDAALWARLGWAVFKVVGQGKAENAFVFGEGLLAESLLKVYRGPLVIEDPKEILSKIANLYGSVWYDFGKAQFVPASGKSGDFVISHPEGIPIPECFVPMVRGVLSRFIKENGGKNVRATCLEEQKVGKEKLFKLTVNLAWD
jgi:hypothetical protein